MDRAEPYNVNAARFRLGSGKEVLFLQGQAMNVPFGSVSDEEKRNIGSRVIELHEVGPEH